LADYLKIPEVARRLDVSEPTVRRMVKGGKLPSVFVGGAYRVSEADLAEFLENAKVEPGKAEAPSSQRSLFNGGEEERRASLRSWVGFAGRLADRWAGEIEEREAGKKRAMMLPNLHWAVEIMGTYTDVVEAVATDPNYDAGVYGREEVRELYAATTRMREAVDHTRDWFPSRQEDPKMAEVIHLRRAAIERAEKRLGARAS
jgi:excisionase family DNA binding protein